MADGLSNGERQPVKRFGGDRGRQEREAQTPRKRESFLVKKVEMSGAFGRQQNPRKGTGLCESTARNPQAQLSKQPTTTGARDAPKDVGQAGDGERRGVGRGMGEGR